MSLHCLLEFQTTISSYALSIRLIKVIPSTLTHWKLGWLISMNCGRSLEPSREGLSAQSCCSGLGTGPGATVGGVEGIKDVVSDGGAGMCLLDQFPPSHHPTILLPMLPSGCLPWYLHTCQIYTTFIIYLEVMMWTSQAKMGRQRCLLLTHLPIDIICCNWSTITCTIMEFINWIHKVLKVCDHDYCKGNCTEANSVCTKLSDHCFLNSSSTSI